MDMILAWHWNFPPYFFDLLDLLFRKPVGEVADGDRIDCALGEILMRWVKEVVIRP